MHHPNHCLVQLQALRCGWLQTRGKRRSGCSRSVWKVAAWIDCIERRLVHAHVKGCVGSGQCCNVIPVHMEGAHITAQW